LARTHRQNFKSCSNTNTEHLQKLHMQSNYTCLADKEGVSKALTVIKSDPEACYITCRNLNWSQGFCYTNFQGAQKWTVFSNFIASLQLR